MKKRSITLNILLIIAMVSLVAATGASAGNEPVGERINLYQESIEFPAETPFHIMHGWVQTSEDEAIGIFDFELEVDGVLQTEDIKLFSADSGSPDILWRLFLYNFADGMTGAHTFTGHWYAPCQYAVDNLNYSGLCATPNEKVETNSRTLEVTFVTAP